MIKRISCFIIAAALAMLTACASGSQNTEPQSNAESGAYGGSANDYQMPLADSADSGYSSEISGDAKLTSPVVAEQARMQVKKALLDMETADFDAAAANIRAVAENAGGYVQSFSTEVYRNYDDRELKRGDMVLRVPSENYGDALSRVRESARVLNVSVTEEDVSGQYYDALSRRDSLLSQESRLIDQIDKAKDVGDLLALEQKLSEIRRDIELLERRANALDDEAAMSTITVSLTETVTGEVLRPVPTDFGSQLAEGFLSGVNGVVSLFQWLVIALAAMIVPLTAIGICVLTVILVIRAVRRRRTRKAGVQ